MPVNHRPPAKLVWEDNYLVRQDAFYYTSPPPSRSFIDYILCRTRF